MSEIQPLTAEHKHELYEDEFPIHCDGCGDSFSAMGWIREQQNIIDAKDAEITRLREELEMTHAKLERAQEGNRHYAALSRAALEETR